MGRAVHYFTDAEQFGGAEHALLTLLGSIDRQGWEPTLLYHEDVTGRQLAERAEKIGVPVRPVARLPLGLGGARQVPGLARELRASAPAVFHAHLSWPLAAKFALAAAALARIPAIVATVHVIPEFALDRSNRLQLQLLSRFVGRYVAVSNDIAARLSEEFGWPAAKIDVVHNGVDLDEFVLPPDPGVRSELAGNRQGPVFLTVARLDQQKGHDVLLRAATGVAEGSFVFAGEGPERRRLEVLAAELQLDDRVVFLGRRSDVPDLLAAADVFVLPSRFEGSSLAILEAMASGKPIVCSAIGGTDELVVHGETGLLVPVEDANALTAALRELAADSSLRTRLGAAARKRAEQCFSLATSTSRVERIYEELLERA
jgi:glycosyltransferase involved in cell wall biosynthesis